MWTNPRNSVVAQIGLTGLAEELITLRTEHLRWVSTANTYGELIGKCLKNEADLQPAVDKTYSELTTANENYHNLSTQQAQLMATRESYMKHRPHYLRRSTIAAILIDIMQKLKDGHTSGRNLKWDVATPVSHVRALLQLTSSNDCMKLTQNECVAICRLLHVFRYHETTFFRGLWKCPPKGFDLPAWFEAYGDQPTLKTSKGDLPTDTLHFRVMHYLGFSEDRSVPAARRSRDPVQPSIANMFNADLDDWLAALGLAALRFLNHSPKTSKTTKSRLQYLR